MRMEFSNKFNFDERRHKHTVARGILGKAYNSIFFSFKEFVLMYFVEISLKSVNQ